MSERLCDTCIKADVCKYKDEVMKNQNEILARVVTSVFCLKVQLSCEKWRGELDNANAGAAYGSGSGSGCWIMPGNRGEKTT